MYQIRPHVVIAERWWIMKHARFIGTGMLDSRFDKNQTQVTACIDICQYYDKYDACVISDICDYDLSNTVCMMDKCGIDIN